MSHKAITARGVSPILPTPFTQSGALDVPSLRRLIDYQKTQGVTGVSILGFMGEADKLSLAERDEVIATVVEQAGDLDVWVGVRTLGTMGSVEMVQRAAALGAHAAFVAPIPVQNDAALYAHFKTVSDSAEIPIMIHDYPASHGVTLSAELIARIGKDGICPFIKLEDPPIGPKLTAIRELSNDSIGVFGGLGAIYFLEELERGTLGIMTGFSFSNVLVNIYNQFASGDHAGAAATFGHYASLIRYEFQPKIGLALRKYAYNKRGIFSTTVVREPIGLALDAYTAAEYERILDRCGLSLDPQ